MKNPFKLKGFDTIIAKEQALRGEFLTLPLGTTTVIDGNVEMRKIEGEGNLMVNGFVAADVVLVQDLIITGNVEIKSLIVKGTLHLKAGASLTADAVQAAVLNVEPGGRLNATLKSIQSTAQTPENA